MNSHSVQIPAQPLLARHTDRNETFYASHRAIFSLKNILQTDAMLAETGILSNWLSCLVQNNLLYLGLLVLCFHTLVSYETNTKDKVDKGNIC